MEIFTHYPETNYISMEYLSYSKTLTRAKKIILNFHEIKLRYFFNNNETTSYIFHTFFFSVAGDMKKVLVVFLSTYHLDRDSIKLFLTFYIQQAASALTQPNWLQSNQSELKV